MISVSSHDYEARLQASDLLQQNISGCQIRFQDMHLIGRPMRFEKLGSKFDRSFRFSVIASDGYQVNGFTTGQPEKLEGLQRPRDLASSAISDNDATSYRQLAGHDHNWTRTAAENLCTHIIRLILRFEMEVCFAAEN